MAVGEGAGGPRKRKRLPCFRMAVRVGGRVPCVGFTHAGATFLSCCGLASGPPRGARPWNPPVLHCDQLDLSLLCLVLIGELLVADETQLLHLAEVLQQCGLLQLSPDLGPALVQTRQATLQLSLSRLNHWQPRVQAHPEKGYGVASAIRLSWTRPP